MNPPVWIAITPQSLASRKQVQSFTIYLRPTSNMDNTSWYKSTFPIYRMKNDGMLYVDSRHRDMMHTNQFNSTIPPNGSFANTFYTLASEIQRRAPFLYFENILVWIAVRSRPHQHSSISLLLNFHKISQMSAKICDMVDDVWNSTYLNSSEIKPIHGLYFDSRLDQMAPVGLYSNPRGNQRRIELLT